MPTRFNLPHIDIAASRSSQPYVGQQAGGSDLTRVRAEHGRRLQNELTAALNMASELRVTDDRLPEAAGSFVEVTLSTGSKPDKLDMKTEGIRSGAARQEGNNGPSVLLFVPDDARPALEHILSDYLTQNTRSGQPKNKTKVEAIEAFRAARLERFWTDDPAALPTDPQQEIWWALWCWKDKDEDVTAACAALNVRVASTDRWMHFPEVDVIPVYTTRTTIELLLFTTGAISELRRASETPVFFIDDVRGDQRPWVEDLAERIEWPSNDAPAVCLLDTGVNRSHALIEPALTTRDQHAIDAEWGSNDSDGHGTSMAGLALHGDLTAALSDQGERVLSHRIESVKILPPNGFAPTELRNYGPITQAAVALPEIAMPERRRVFCMAITNENVSGAIPSAWSAAIDQAAAGTMIGDNEDAPNKRLIILSGGNTPAEIDARRIRSQDDYPMEDPSQAWNALTVGGYTDLIEINDNGYEAWSPMVQAGELSPHSRTSVTWPQSAPFKPEIVMEAGNRALNPARTEALTVGSLSLLTTGDNVTQAPLVAFEATSAAASQAARLAARISADHPEFWPEMIRGLMIHSAEWTPNMLAAIQARTAKRERYALIRRFGYGVPDYERATASASNHLALLAQADIQPFRLEGGRNFNECHYYNLPIPRDMLEALGNETVELKITLSYFINPNPGLGANVDPQRYRSHGLRFDLRRKGETVGRFKSRVNAAEPDDNSNSVDPDDERWKFGGKSISAGSLHCDVWAGPAIDLAGRDMLCIKPVNGWSRKRSTREVCNAVHRYALVVTIKTQDTEIDLYTPIEAAINVPVTLETPV